MPATTMTASAWSVDATATTPAAPGPGWSQYCYAHPEGRKAVFVGDSITDGFGVQPDTNQRWTDPECTAVPTLRR